MRIGYARVSTQVQNLDLQIDALKKSGCEKIFTDKMSGGVQERPGLSEAINFARQGDSLVVWRLDRLGRSLQHLIECVNRLQISNIGFASIQENIDTSTMNGKLVFHIFGAMAEFEKSLIRERTMSGLAAARARGRVGGRPRKINQSQLSLIKAVMTSDDRNISELCKTLGVSRSTIYRQKFDEK